MAFCTHVYVRARLPPTTFEDNRAAPDGLCPKDGQLLGLEEGGAGHREGEGTKLLTKIEHSARKKVKILLNHAL